MEPKRQKAYRDLLYFMVLNIRGNAGRVTSLPRKDFWKWWNPNAVRIAYRAYHLANAIHHLAACSVSDFTGFDEERFWRDMDDLDDRIPGMKNHCLAWFNRSLGKDSPSPPSDITVQ